MKENEKDQVQTLKDALFSQSKHAAQRMDDAELAKCDAFCADYIGFMNTAKTEREATAFVTAALEKAGYVPFKPGMALKAGDKVYLNNRGKAVILATIGTAPIGEGVRLCAAHIDSPRLDLKQHPLYASDPLLRRHQEVPVDGHPALAPRRHHPQGRLQGRGAYR